MKAYQKNSKKRKHKKKILCRRCNKEIRIKNDLVVSNTLFLCSPLHSSCYGKKFKGLNIGSYSYPVNSLNFGIFTFVSILVSLMLIFITLIMGFSLERSPENTGTFWGALILTIISFMPLKLRIESLIRFETRLPKR